MEESRTPDRRTVLLFAGGSLTAGLAGCLGGDSNGDETNGDENGTDDGNGNESGNGTQNTTENGDENGAENETQNGDANGSENGGENGTENGTENGEENGTENGSQNEEVVDTFTAESRGGFITIGQETEEAAREESLGFPPTEEVPDPLVVEADVYADDTWESTNIEFPELDLSQLLPPEFDAYNISVEFTAPDGYSGTLDRDAGLFTFEGALRLTVTIEEQTVAIEAVLNATTGESGALTGSYNLDADPPTATVVENEYVIDEETEAPLLNDFLGLPAEDPIWMELELEFVE